MTEQQKRELWEKIQNIKNPDLKYEMEFRYLTMYGTIIAVTSLEEGLKTINT